MKIIPPLTALRYFEAVARLGGVTTAARELHVTHSAISQQIRLLEDTMGVPLFEREARGLRLTEEGRLYALEIRVALRDLEQATRRAQSRPHEDELVIATLPSFAVHWLAARLPRFRKRHPHYRVRLQTSIELGELRNGMADVAIRMGQGQWPDLAKRLLFEDELMAVASPGFNRGKLPKTAEAVLACPLICSTDAPWSDWFRAAGIDGRAIDERISANDSNVALACAALGQGVALERRSLVADYIDSGQLVAITSVRIPYPYPYWLVWPQREVLSTKQTHFIEWIAEEVATYLRVVI